MGPLAAPAPPPRNPKFRKTAESVTPTTGRTPGPAALLGSFRKSTSPNTPIEIQIPKNREIRHADPPSKSKVPKNGEICHARPPAPPQSWVRFAKSTPPEPKPEKSRNLPLLQRPTTSR